MRKRPSTANQRWRNRTLSQQNRRKKWIEPTTPTALLNSNANINTLSSYAMPNYVVGNSTPQALADTRERLGHDLAPPPVELSAVEGLIYEMADTSQPVEMEGSIPVVNHQPIETVQQDESEPSPYALPRRPPRVYPHIEPEREPRLENWPIPQFDTSTNIQSQSEITHTVPSPRQPPNRNTEWNEFFVQDSLHNSRTIGPPHLAPPNRTSDSFFPNQRLSQEVSPLSPLSPPSPPSQLRQPPSNRTLASQTSTESAGSRYTADSRLDRSEGTASSTPTFGSILGEEESVDKGKDKGKERKGKFRRMFS
jgi:hypothetical protein